MWYVWGEGENGYKILVGNSERKEIDGRIVYINRIEGRRLYSSGSGLGQVAGCCENGDETSGSIKCEKCIYRLRKRQPFERVYAPWS